jgi:hypothetical protein
MKLATLICAGAVVLFAGSATAQSGNAPGIYGPQHGKPVTTRHVKKVRMPQPSDPYAKYWNDPSRQAPPFSWGGPKGGG